MKEIIQEIIRLTDAMSAESERRCADSPIGTPFCYGLEPPDPTQAERDLKNFLFSQTVADIYTLAALLYFGRQELDFNDFSQRYDEMQARFPTPAIVIRQLMEKVLLPGYLSKGLRLAAEQGINVDALLD
jgi:hypothetical protein